MSQFNMKAIPKDVQPFSFKNFYEWSTAPQLKDFEGRVVYINADNPGKHIYNPYYVENGTALSMQVKKNGTTVFKMPLITLQELNVDDIIIHFSIEEYQKYEEAKKKTK